jgi:hypothetical protein
LLTGHAALLSLPGPSAGVSAGLGLRYRSLWSDAELRYDLPAAKDASGGAAVRAHFLGATLAACHGNRTLGLCPIGLLGRLSGVGNGVTDGKSASSWFAGVGLRGAAELRLLPALFLRIHLDLLYRLTPTVLELRGQSIWQAPAVIITPGLGIGGQL